MGHGRLTFGFIGLGDMGSPMARRLAGSGHELIVWNRTPAKAQALERNGALVAATPEEVAAKADLIGLCLTSHAAVDEVAFGKAGLFTGAHRRMSALADFSTGSIDAARDLAKRAKSCGVEWVDSPVSGGVPAAESGGLVIFAGGTAAAVEQLGPLFGPLARQVTRMGGSGSGQGTKLLNQAIVATNLLVMSETIAAARRVGIDASILPSALKGGFADSSPLQIFGPRMATHDFEPRLGAIGLIAKDSALMCALAAANGADMPMLELANRIYSRILELGSPPPTGDLAMLIELYEGGGSGPRVSTRENAREKGRG